MPKSRQQRRARSRNPLKQKRHGTTLFTAVILIVLLGGGALIAFFRANPPPLTRGASVGEHWHASLKVYICGKRMTNYPTVEGDLHSHADGFIHIHPNSQAAAGDFANLGTYLATYETSLVQLPNGKRELSFPGGTKYTDGDRCPKDKKRYNIRVTNKGKPVTGDPSEFIPHEGDAIVIQFGPRGEKPMPNPYSIAKQIPDVGTGGATPAPDAGPPAQQQQPPPMLPPQETGAEATPEPKETG